MSLVFELCFIIINSRLIKNIDVTIPIIILLYNTAMTLFVISDTMKLLPPPFDKGLNEF